VIIIDRIKCIPVRAWRVFGFGFCSATLPPSFFCDLSTFFDEKNGTISNLLGASALELPRLPQLAEQRPFRGRLRQRPEELQ